MIQIIEGLALQYFIKPSMRARSGSIDRDLSDKENQPQFVILFSRRQRKSNQMLETHRMAF